MEIERPYAVMDESGKVAEWLEAGRGLRVWQSQDLGAGRPELLTPGDVESEPHWAYKGGGSAVLGLDDVVFFRRVRVVKSWEDRTPGWKAAQRFAESQSAEDAQVPIGRKLTRYTVERFTLESNVKVKVPGHPGRPPAIPASTAYERPLHVEYRIGVVEWVCIIRGEGV